MTEDCSWTNKEAFWRKVLLLCKTNIVSYGISKVDHHGGGHELGLFCCQVKLGHNGMFHQDNDLQLPITTNQWACTGNVGVRCLQPGLPALLFEPRLSLNLNPRSLWLLSEHALRFTTQSRFTSLKQDMNLNPIENIWPVRSVPACTQQFEWILSFCQEEWPNIQTEFCQKFVDDRKHLVKVKPANWHLTKYQKSWNVL